MINWFPGRSISAWHLSIVKRVSQTQTEPWGGGPAGPMTGMGMAAHKEGGSLLFLGIAIELLLITGGEEMGRKTCSVHAVTESGLS